MLRRTAVEVAKYLPEEQAGFRKERGCRDNILLLSRIITNTLERGEEGVVVFLDYKAAFDSVSHLFLDESLGVAGASDKTRAMFRAVYGKANAVVRVRKGNGEEVFSESFDVRRGVVQGDIFSPLCFIIALARVMELHDTMVQYRGG